MKEIGPVIKRAREELGLSQEEVAEYAGISARSLGNMEMGKANPQLDTLLKVLEFYGLAIQIKTVN